MISLFTAHASLVLATISATLVLIVAEGTIRDALRPKAAPRFASYVDKPIKLR